MTEVKAEDLGLDARSGYRLFVSDECIAVNVSQTRSLEYYGGFEYVDSVYTKIAGDYKFYFREDSRVDDHIEIYFEKVDA